MAIINTSDERFLRMVSALHTSYKEEVSTDDEVVAYTAEGEALTQAKIVENNKEALQSIEEGHYKSHNEIRQKYAIK
ncbi:MAG: hypothetical protein ACON4A_00825 [Flavobacteriaceae bacterium]